MSITIISHAHDENEPCTPECRPSSALIKCAKCGAIVPRGEVYDNGHTIWTEDDYMAIPNICGPVVGALDAEYINE